MTSNESLALSLPLSVTEQLTVVVPSGSTSPIAAEQVGLGSGESSASVAPTTKAAVQPPVVSPSIGKSSGTVMVGGVLETTSTWKVTAGVPRIDWLSNVPSVFT